MVVGTLSVVLHLHGMRSLKDKRSVIRRILSKTRDTFNVAAAEVAHQDAHDRADIAFATVGNDVSYVNAVMDKVLDHVENMHLAEIVDHDIEIMSLSEKGL